MELNSGSETRRRRRVGLIYDDRMCKHFTPDGDYHPENPNRILSIWKKLQSSGIPQRCVVLSAKEAEDKYIAAVHTKNHIDLIKTISSKKLDSRRHRIAAKFNSIYFNEGSSEAAHLAAGSVLEVTEKVAKGELDSAFAIVRPPGHHAEEDEPMGFCLYNNVAVATSFLLNERQELGINKILIVDWDVHHGNGTQKMFWKDPRVLFFSVHRHEFGSFYPASDDGSHIMVGEGPGAGYNINVPWENGRCGDADYLAVWDHVLIPIAKEFRPDIIIISAGFDAAIGDPLGGCCVTPCGYAILLKKLMEFAQGKIVMALEGGYNLDSLANSVLACVEVLLEDKPIIGLSEAYPFESTWRVIQSVREQLCTFWSILKGEIPKKLTSRKTSLIQVGGTFHTPSTAEMGVQTTPPHSPPQGAKSTSSQTGLLLMEISSPDFDVENDNSPRTISQDLEKAVQDVIQPLSEMRVGAHSNDEVNTGCSSWRSEFSKIDVWYASYGSNMWKSRFLCYIEGGQVEGMKNPCSGSLDKRPPKEIIWKTVPHRLFFGRDHTKTWGPGGVAFLDPESNSQDKAYMCIYRITLEQFNDVLLQENVPGYDMSSPLFDLTDLDSVMKNQYFPVEALEGGWYYNVVHMGNENGIPILTMTCTISAVEKFKSGKFPLSAPAKGYVNILVRGLEEGKQLSEEEAMAYILEASTKPLL
ncbi:histone deacetylase 5 isoform X1 [Camellia sinensis]|uniref:histone deacetylase 5 isoform X1 n=1 Tax=Camellia sinensis TaxID=4442 RepID=UPI0010361823|nr:histone deacetylase 5 isoform X1 [Camellia sinensis]